MKKLLTGLTILASIGYSFAASDLQLKDLFFDKIDGKQKIVTNLCNIGSTMEGSSQISITFSKIVNPIISSTYVAQIHLLNSECVKAYADKTDIQATDKDTVRVNVSGAKGETNLSNNTITRSPNGSLDFSSTSTVSSIITSSSISSVSSTSSSASNSSTSNNIDITIKDFVVTPSQKNIRMNICSNGLSNANIQTLVKNLQTGKYVVFSTLSNGCSEVNKSFSELDIDYKAGANYDIQVLTNYKKDIFEPNFGNNASNLNIVYNNWTWKGIDPNSVSVSSVAISSSSSSISSISSSTSSTSSVNGKINLDGFPTMKKYCRVFNNKIRVCLPYQAAKLKVDRAYAQYEKLLANLTNEEKISKINETIVQLKTKYTSLTKPAEKLSVEYMLFKLTSAKGILSPTNQTTFDINSILN